MPKKRWWSETSYQPKRAKQPWWRIFNTVKSLLQKMTKIDPKDAFFMVPIADQFQHLLFQVLIPVSMSLLWAILCSESFHKNSQISHRITENHGRMACDLHGWHVINGQFWSPHSYIALFLLENLGLVVNNKKKFTFAPCQQIKFLGMAMNSQNMELRFPGEKIKIRSEAQHFLTTPICLCSIAYPMGKLNAALQMAPLSCCSLH